MHVARWVHLVIFAIVGMRDRGDLDKFKGSFRI